MDYSNKGTFKWKRNLQKIFFRERLDSDLM